MFNLHFRVGAVPPPVTDVGASKTVFCRFEEVSITAQSLGLSVSNATPYGAPMALPGQTSRQTASAGDDHSGSLDAAGFRHFPAIPTCSRLLHRDDKPPVTQQRPPQKGTPHRLPATPRCPLKPRSKCSPWRCFRSGVRSRRLERDVRGQRHFPAVGISHTTGLLRREQTTGDSDFHGAGGNCATLRFRIVCAGGVRHSMQDRILPGGRLAPTCCVPGFLRAANPGVQCHADCFPSCATVADAARRRR